MLRKAIMILSLFGAGTFVFITGFRTGGVLGLGIMFLGLTLWLFTLASMAEE
jgi:hypothetical protein